MNRKTGLIRGILIAMCLAASCPVAAQVLEITLGQSLTPNDRNHRDEFRSEFDGRTITLKSLLWVVDPDLTMEETAPAAVMVASCRPGRVILTLAADKYLEGYMGRALPEDTKNASTKWTIWPKSIGLEAQMAVQDRGRVLIAFSDQSVVDILSALYEDTSHVDLLLVLAGGRPIPRAVPAIRLKINRSIKQSMAALAQTLNYCEAVVARR